MSRDYLYNMTSDPKETALDLAERLLKAVWYDSDLAARAAQIRDRIRLPMTEVLDKVPGLTVSDKIERIGVSRQAYYWWLNGKTRPNATQAKKLARMTGYDASEIRGRGSKL